MTRRILTVFAVAAMIALAGCNTMEGLGKDLQQLGGTIEKKAEEKK